MQSNIREKIEELDLLRALAAVAVILIHVTATPLVLGVKGSLYHYLITAGNQLARFSIPAFIFITGFVLFYNYRECKSIDWHKFFAKRFSFILVPYLAWSTFYFLFKQYINFRQISIEQIWPEFLWALLLGESYYHLYFVILISQFYILFPLILPLWKRVQGRGGLVTLLVLTLYFIWVYLLFNNIKPGNSWVVIFLFHYQGKLFLTWLGFFVLGAYCGSRLEVFRQFIVQRLKLLVLGAIVLWVAMALEFYSRIADPAISVAYAATSIRPLGIVFTLVTIMAIMALARKYVINSKVWGPRVKAYADRSYGIYLIHPLILTVLEVLENRLGLGIQWWLVAGNFVLCCGLSYLVIACLSANKWTRLLTGR